VRRRPDSCLPRFGRPRMATTASARARKCADKRAEQPLALETRHLTHPTGANTIKLARSRHPSCASLVAPVPVTRPPNRMQLTLQDAFSLAARHESADRRADARAIYDQILAAVPGHPGALLCIARQHRRDRNLDAALASLQEALAGAQSMALPAAEIWLEMAGVHLAAGARGAARAAYAQVLDVSPGMSAALVGLGNLALEDGDYMGAETHYRDAIAQTPEGVAWVNLALALDLQGQLDNAEAAAQKGLEHASHLAEAWQTAANVALRQGDLGKAEERCRRGLERLGAHGALLHLLGQVLKRRGAFMAAREALTAAASAAPQDTSILLTLSGVSLELGRAADARGELEQAIALGASSAETFDNLGLACEAQGDLEAALDAYSNAVERNPSLTPAIANYARAVRVAGDFDRAQAAERRLFALLDDPASDPRCPPMMGLIAGLGPLQQATVARRWSASMLPPVGAPLPIGRRGTRLRVGYLSSDFREHPLAHLMAGLFERHDRRRFETFAYSTAAADGSAIGRRIRAAFEHWRDLPTVGDAVNGQRIRADSLDVLVELNGHTMGGRLGALALRPAPIQIHYLGFPGTLGYDAIDAIVADAMVLPPGADRHYTERVIRLPRCYFVTDGSRAPPRRLERVTAGLPENAVVLVSFNQTHKLTRRFFDVWLDTLASVPAAVLWLWAPNALTQHNLREHAIRRGIEAKRILFAERVSQDAHIARLSAADLALDVLPYGSHTTGVDALWAGVPMLTCRGDTFAGRVGASLLQAAGLDELVTGDLDAYRAALLSLAADRERLAGYREYLDRERPRLPLFDTEGFTQDWEDMLESLVARGCDDRLTPTDSFDRPF
jgi:protein O-GlcNAc transferase